MPKKETKAAKPIEFSFDSTDEVHEAIQDESSEANLAAIGAAQETETETAREHSTNTDSAGTLFNPELHAVDKEGNPSVTPLGKFRKKRGASKVATQTDAAKQIADEQAARAAGMLCADMIVGSACTLLGPEWQPVGPDMKQAPIEFDEHANLRKAFGDYFVAKGISDFPPGIALTIAVSSYAGPRLAAGEETKSRLTKAKFWIGEKLENWKRKRKDNAAQSNRRDDGKRKDDNGKETMRNESPETTRHARP